MKPPNANLWARLTTFENLWLAYKKAARGKRSKPATTGLELAPRYGRPPGRPYRGHGISPTNWKTKKVLEVADLVWCLVSLGRLMDLRIDEDARPNLRAAFATSHELPATSYPLIINAMNKNQMMVVKNTSHSRNAISQKRGRSFSCSGLSRSSSFLFSSSFFHGMERKAA
jgi:hypothetical protein